MTLIFDENISYRILKKVQTNFPGCLHVTDVRPALKSDFEIFLFAKKEGHTIVTFDEDFHELQLINGYPPKIIWLRFGNSSTNYILQRLLEKRSEIFSFFDLEEIGMLEIY